MKRSVLLSVLISSVSTFAIDTHAVEFDPIVRKDSSSALYCPTSNNDEICRMAVEDAKIYCIERGTRLPNAREWAEFAVSRGAKGIKETMYPKEQLAGAYPNQALVREYWENFLTGYSARLGGFLTSGHQLLNSSNGGFIIGERVTSVEFYLNSSGYRPEPGDSENPYGGARYWTSSFAENNHSWPTYFDGYTGRFGREGAMQGFAVRCIRRQ